MTAWRWVNCALTAALLALGGCAAAPSVEQRPRAFGPLPTAFLLKARVSVRQDQQVDSFALEWTRAQFDRAPRDVMRILTPFGSQVAELTITPTLALLVRGTERHEAANVEELTKPLLGIAITPNQLLDWLQHSSAEPVHGWLVSGERVAVFGGVSLATRISAIRGDQVVRVVLDDFSEH